MFVVQAFYYIIGDGDGAVDMTRAFGVRNPGSIPTLTHPPI